MNQLIGIVSLGGPLAFAEHVLRAPSRQIPTLSSSFALWLYVDEPAAKSTSPDARPAVPHDVFKHENLQVGLASCRLEIVGASPVPDCHWTRTVQIQSNSCAKHYVTPRRQWLAKPTQRENGLCDDSLQSTVRAASLFDGGKPGGLGLCLPRELPLPRESPSFVFF